jgi:hypothetical protein
MSPAAHAAITQKCWLCYISSARLLFAIKAETKALEILSALWFFILAGYLHAGYDGAHNTLLPALQAVAPRSVWEIVLIGAGLYQIGAIGYGKVWCRKLASLISSTLWSGVAVGLYYIAGNIPSVGLTAAMILSMSIAALGLYDEPHRSSD